MISATVTEIKPTRNAVHAVYSIEDDARLPGLADAIRRDLAMAMTEKIDRTIFLGDSTARMKTQPTLSASRARPSTESTLTQAAKIKAGDWLGFFAGLIDGQYAASVGI